jgi:hypothetical protein
LKRGNCFQSRLKGFSTGFSGGNGIVEGKFEGIWEVRLKRE